MPYLIDGHNLIGALPDLHLAEIDDEEQLLKRLGDFCRRSGKKVEVYFDRAAPGRSGRFAYGAVTAVLVPAGGTADAAIARRLSGLGRAARNWTVVSSDRAVQTAARHAGASVLTADAFAGMMRGPGNGADDQRETEIRPEEVEDWLRLFGEDETG